MSFNTNYTIELADHRRQKSEELTKRWPRWDFYSRMMKRPPLEVMDWLCQVYERLGSVEKLEMSIACGGFHPETAEICSCDMRLQLPLRDAARLSRRIRYFCPTGCPSKDAETRRQIMEVYDQLPSNTSLRKSP